MDEAYEQQKQAFKRKMNDLQAEKERLKQELLQQTADRDRQPATVPPLVPKDEATTSAQSEVQHHISPSDPVSALESAACSRALNLHEARQTQPSSAAELMRDGLATISANIQEDMKIKVGIRVRPVIAKEKLASSLKVKGNTLQASPKHAFMTFGK